MAIKTAVHRGFYDAASPYADTPKGLVHLRILNSTNVHIFIFKLIDKRTIEFRVNPEINVTSDVDVQDKLNTIEWYNPSTITNDRLFKIKMVKSIINGVETKLILFLSFFSSKKK